METRPAETRAEQTPAAARHKRAGRPRLRRDRLEATVPVRKAVRRRRLVRLHKVRCGSTLRLCKIGAPPAEARSHALAAAVVEATPAEAAADMAADTAKRF
jgi:hypothetical protein